MLKNKSAEKDIRDFLNDRGYYGKTAKFEELELHAIERPGWLQVFRFSVRAKSQNDEWVLLFGAMREDERFKKCNIECYPKLNQRDVVLKKWSDGLIQPTYGSSFGKSYSVTKTITETLIFISLIGAVLALLSLLS